MDLVNEEAPCTRSDIEQQPNCGYGSSADPSDELQEKDVGDDNQQGGHADDELHQQVGCRSEMSLNDAQRRGDGGSCHHGEQRHRKDGSRHPFRDVFLFH